MNYASKTDLETNNIHAIEFFMSMPAYDKHMKEVLHKELKPPPLIDLFLYETNQDHKSQVQVYTRTQIISSRGYRLKRNL